MEQNTEKPEGREEQRVPIRAFLIRVAVLCFLLFFLAGAQMFPEWWVTFLFHGGMFSADSWRAGIAWNFENLLAPLLVCAAALVLFWLSLRRSTKFAQLMAGTRRFFCGTGGNSIAGTLAALAFLSALSIAFNASSIAANQDLARFVKEQHPGNVAEPALSQPALIVFMDRANIESLYSQYEPDLVPAIVKEEIGGTSQITAGLTLDGFLKTEAGKTELQKRETEYREHVKTADRKLKDLLRYLDDQKQLKRIVGFQGSSQEIKDLAQAVTTFKKHGLPVNGPELARVRDGLLQADLGRFTDGLEKLDGLAVVEGDWTIREDAGFYVISQSLADVSSPPICEVRIPAAALPAEYRETKATFHLTVFGAVLTRPSATSQTLRLRPIAIF